MEDNETKIINHKITDLLSRREYAFNELLDKLVRLDFDRDLCLQQLSKFSEKDIQSDQRYCEMYVRSAFNKGKGPNLIRHFLSTHHIDEPLIDAQLNDDTYDWFELADIVRVKKYGEERPQDFREKQKQMRFLQYRGFTHEQIAHCF